MRDTDIQEKASRAAPAIRALLRPRLGAGCVTVFHHNKYATELCRTRNAFRQAVAGRKDALFISGKQDTEAQYEAIAAALKRPMASGVRAPRLIALQNTGVFAAGQSRAEADAVIRDFHRGLPGGQKTPAAGRAEAVSGGRVDGKVAVVTGSAQGLGNGIAEALAREGAYVVIADINERAARAFATDLCRFYGDGKALAVGADVANEASIKNLMVQTVLAYGGIDVLISNAGILRAGGLEEMDLSTFELVTKINYSAYYLCVKHASRYMKIDNRFDKSHYCDIIQVNSKSGLVGSNRNFAYAGGKFGSIGLTQSFALELVEHNIKVNAVCPGNYFEGPLWADPENGLFAQYLRAGKAPGAKTIADVKLFYESKVPMKRGCRVRDVAAAVLYLIEQTYETGQAVPVTGGQVMLK